MERIEPHLKRFLGLIGLTALVGVYAYIDRGALSVNLFCAHVMAVGVWGLVYALRSVRRSLVCYRWEPRKYRVAASRVMLEEGPSDGINRMYRPEYRLEYEFGGKAYSRTNDDINLHLGELFATFGAASAHIERVRAGLYGDYLYVNPANPAEAFVRRGVTRDQLGALVLCLILVVLPLLTVADLIEWRP
ncbi:DUF3592 domain-containing protein [Microbulbifer sediminum]|uniref:DUF3592 domain-containing protein n=1 Tax=Microbulbifer sediminum TaxID=2904250 RepID=UPI001F2113B6|nr:DUF3592 domain-containing protein [Microbulbifer sediminum]